MLYLRNNIFGRLRRAKSPCLVLFSFMLLVLIYCIYKGPDSSEIIDSTISLHKISKSSYVLKIYSSQLKLNHLIGEPRLSDLPDKMEIYLVNLLQSNSSSPTVKEDIIRFYLEIILDLDSCCKGLSNNEDKNVIGDIIKYTRHSDLATKLRAVRLMEAIRVEEGLPRSINLWPEIDTNYDVIEEIFDIYEAWWELPISTKEKMRIDPLRSRYHMYRWTD
jgi:hypothetical protein